MIDWLWLVLRAAGLMLTLQAAGTALFNAGFARRLVRAAPVLRRLGVRAGIGALAVLGVQVLFEPVHLAGEWSGLADSTMLRLFAEASTARALAVRIVGVACLVLGLRAASPRRQLLAPFGSFLAVGSFLLTGHTAVSPRRLLLAPLLFLHLSIVAFWFGSLWPLRQLTALEARADAARVIAAFSAVAVWLVPVIALAGVTMAVLLLPDAAALRQPYGLLLLGKVALFTLLMGLAALNKLRLTPALARSETYAPARLRGSIALEYVLIGVIFAVTAVMTGSFSPTPD